MIDKIKQFIDKYTTFLEDGKVDEVLSDSNTALSKFDADRKKLCDEHIELVKQKGGKSKRLKKTKLSKRVKLLSKRKRR